MSSLSISLNMAQKMLVQYGHSTIFALGMLGSLINICLFSRRLLRSNSCCIYFLASSASAIILLLIGIIPQLYTIRHSPNPFTTITSFCKARSYLNQTSAMICRWLLVIACIDQCICCSHSVRIRRLSSVVIAQRSIVILVIFWLTLPVHTLVYSDITPPGNIACSINIENVALYHRFYTIIMGGALPSIIAFICSLIIWKNFQQRRKCRAIVIANHGIEQRKKIRDQQIMIMLLLKIGIFFLSTIPFMSFNIYDTMTKTVSNKSADRKAIEAFLKTLTELLVYSITLSFYSNTLVSKTFRNELFVLLKLTFIIHRCQRQSQVKPSKNTITRSYTQQMLTIRKTDNPSLPKV